MKRIQSCANICLGCGSPFWGNHQEDFCPACRREQEKELSEAAPSGAGFAVHSAGDKWRTKGRPAWILPKTPVKGVYQDWQPEARPYPGRIVEDRRKRKTAATFAMIEVASGRVLVLREGEYQEVSNGECLG